MSAYIISTELIHHQDELEWHRLPLNPTVSLDNLCKICLDRIIGYGI